MAQKMSGAMFSLSGKKMDSDKKRFKNGLATVTVEEIIKEYAAEGLEISKEQAEEEAWHRRTLAEVYSRTDVEKELTKQVAEKDQKIRTLEEGKEKNMAQLLIIDGILDEALKKGDLAVAKKASSLLKDILKNK
jgi:hypothetical protein